MTWRDLLYEKDDEAKGDPVAPLFQVTLGAKMRRVVPVLCMLVCLCSCSSVNEHGYRHLMVVLDRRSGIVTFERLKLDGATCITVNPAAHLFCSKSRDGAAESAAEWIEHNIPEDDTPKDEGYDDGDDTGLRLWRL
jgi:hypothetical protein